MKILLINSFYYPDMLGGAEHSVKNLAESLASLGHKVSVLCTGDCDSRDVINGVSIYRIQTFNIKNSLQYSKGHNNKYEKIIYRTLQLYGYQNHKKIQKIINKLNPDMAHINNYADFGLSIFKLLKDNKIPIIFTGRDYRCICLKGTMIHKNGAMCIKNKKLCQLYSKICHKYISYADCITAPSNYSLNIFKKTLGRKVNSFKCINNSIEVSQDFVKGIYEFKKNRLYHQDKFNLVFLGALDDYKGINLLISTFLKIEDESLVLNIAGEGPLEKEIKNISNPRIVFHGKLNQDQVGELLRESDLLLAPSMWPEPFGRIVIDAYKYLLPVISTGNGGLKELIISGKTGELNNFKSSHELKAIIDKYRDVPFLEVVMLNCAEEVMKYSNLKIALEYESVYKEVLSN